MTKPCCSPTRRQLFKYAGASTLCSAFAGQPGTALAKQDGAQALIDQAFKAQSKGDYVTAESLFRRLVDLGRSDEGIFRGLAWNLSRQWKHDEAIRVALDNNRRNPCAWSVAEVCDAYVSSGDYQNGRKWLRFARENEGQWGDARPAFEAAYELAAVKTYELEYTLDPAVLATVPFLANLKVDFLSPIPFPNLPYQTSNYEVFGATAVKEQVCGGNKCVRITPMGSLAATLRATVTLTPMSYRQKVKDFDHADVPTEVSKFLKSSGSVVIEDETVQSIVQSIRKPTTTASIDSICLWDHVHFKYDGTSGNSGGGTAAVLKRKTGHCEGLTSGVVGLLRAAGIPTRFVRGHGAITGKSGVPTMHTWTEFFVPSVGWIQWDDQNPPFAVPARICIGQFRHLSPYDAPGGGDADTQDLWNFQAVLFPPGATHGINGNAGFTRTKMEL